VSDAALRQLVTLAQPARSHPLWQRDAAGHGTWAAGATARQALVERLTQQITTVADAALAAGAADAARADSTLALP
jgi:hypothetical protein